MKISIQKEDFSSDQESNLLRAVSSATGAIVTFTGLVRDLDSNAKDKAKVSSLFLEHYPGMTERSLQAIIDEAMQRWSLIDATIIHRIGELKASEQIVFVGVSSEHRGEAFAACEFMMDYLKTKAPFWKKSCDESGEHWVAAKQSDEDASSKW